MEKKTKATPKPTTKKVTPKTKKVIINKDINEVELVSYAIKMVIPTGQYANIQPEIIVKSGSIEAAHNFIAPHMNKLWKEYFMVNERRPEVAKPITTQTVPYYPNIPTNVGPAVTTVSAPVMPVVNSTPNVTSNTGTIGATSAGVENIKNALGGTIIGEGLPVKDVNAVQPPDSSVAFTKANQAIDSCVSLDALELIQSQVIKSVKLSHEDKELLMPKLHVKAVELTFPEDEKRGQ